MKKSILLIAAVFTMAIMVTSCKEAKKEEVKTESHEDHTGHDHDEKKDEATAQLAYQCPMDCEKGKTYDAVGTCPTCKMDLKEVKAKHSANCKCLEDGGECTCEPGACKCNEMAECTKCEPGKCECKAEMAKVAIESTHCKSGSCECKA